MDAEELRLYARRAADGEPSALAICIADVLPRADAWLHRLLRGDQLVALEVSAALLEQKLSGVDNWAKVAASEQPWSYLKKIVRSFAVDQSRRRLEIVRARQTEWSVQLEGEPQELVGESALLSSDGDPTSSTPETRAGGDGRESHDDVAPGVGLATLLRLLTDLPPIARAELKVSYGVFELERGEVDAVAARRSVDADLVRQELTAVGGERDAVTLEREQELESRAARIGAILRRLRWIRAAQRDFGDDPNLTPVDLDIPGNYRSVAQIRDLSAAERAGLVAWLETRVADAAKLQARDRAALAAQSGRPDRVRMAVLLGAVAPDADERAKQRAANTLWTRARRSLERLREGRPA